jgi:dTDP-4-dehydrorhamnose 3,5-epimerase
MKFETLSLPGALRISAPKHVDDRGYFFVPYNKFEFAEGGVHTSFVQDNQSCSARAGTLRGLHAQLPPFSQAKLVRVLRGRVLDVIVDARRGSPCYGQHVSVEISADCGTQIFVPHGCLHGFVTREPDTIVTYKVDNGYDQASDRAVCWDDPDLAIDWGLGNETPTLSEKDRAAQSWVSFDTPFEFEAD